MTNNLAGRNLSSDDYDTFINDNPLNITEKEKFYFNESSNFKIILYRETEYLSGLYRNQVILSYIELKINKTSAKIELDLDDFVKDCTNLQNFKINIPKEVKQTSKYESFEEIDWYTVKESFLYTELSWDFVNYNGRYDLDSLITAFKNSSLIDTFTYYKSMSQYDNILSLNYDDLTGQGDKPDEIFTIRLNLLSKYIL